MNIFERFLKASSEGVDKPDIAKLLRGPISTVPLESQDSVSAVHFSETILKEDCSRSLMGKVLIPDQQSTLSEFVNG